MNWTRLFNRIKGTPVHHEDDLDEELAFHRTMKEREFAAGGMTASEARDAARRALGNATLTREDARAQWTFPLLGDLARDFRYGLRSLVANLHSRRPLCSRWYWASGSMRFCSASTTRWP